jgi:uncharacterized protein (UPF0332 family)
MTAWHDIATDNETAARELVAAKRWRSAVSRAYYAVYSAVSAVLAEQGVTFSGPRANPNHADLPDLIESNIAGLRDWERRDLKSAARSLYAHRLAADYDENYPVTGETARDMTGAMNRALVLLERRRTA